jgi:hypothetical protein
MGEQGEAHSERLLRAARKDSVAELRRALRRLGPRVHALRERGTGASPLHLAVMHGAQRCTTALLEAGCDPDARDWAGDTPLHCAVWNAARGVGAVLQLMENGADATIANQRGLTPRQVLVRHRPALFKDSACAEAHLAHAALLRGETAAAIRVLLIGVQGGSPLAALGASPLFDARVMRVVRAFISAG